MTTSTASTYNGWANWETWCVALWIQNDEPLYRMAQQFSTYMGFAEHLANIGIYATPDGADYISNALDYDELNEMMEDL